MSVFEPSELVKRKDEPSQGNWMPPNVAGPGPICQAVSTQPAPRYTPLPLLTRPTWDQREPLEGALVLVLELATTMAEALDISPPQATKDISTGTHG